MTTRLLLLEWWGQASRGTTVVGYCTRVMAKSALLSMGFAMYTIRLACTAYRVADMSGFICACVSVYMSFCTKGKPDSGLNACLVGTPSSRHDSSTQSPNHNHQ